MYNYKIKISCTTKDELCYNNKKISNKNYNRPNFEELINNTDYIETALILYKKEKKFTTKSLEFMCKRKISEDEFKTFIKDMKDIGFSSNNNNTIHLIKINDNKPSEQIFIYYFQSEEKKKIIPKNNNYNYKIKIEWTSKDELCYNNEEISININNNLNLKELINNINYINDFKYIDLKTKSIEFDCKYKISDIDFKTFIEDIQNIGFFSNKDILIHLISNKTISIYKFQSIIKIPIYTTQFLYKKIQQ
jgi:predicted transport protein